MPQPASDRSRKRPAGPDSSRLAAVGRAATAVGANPWGALLAVSSASRASEGRSGQTSVLCTRAVPAMGPASQRGRARTGRSQTRGLQAIKTTYCANSGHGPRAPRQQRHEG